MLEMICVLVADDLTGASDSAVHFAAAGLRVFVPLAPEAAPPDADVLAFSTDSRDLDRDEAICRIRRIACRIQALKPQIVFKKIDSTLRGNTGAEIAAALEAFPCAAAVLNPAFPAMGRVVRDGCLTVLQDPDFLPVELASWLRRHGAPEHPGLTLADAVCNSDLDKIVGQALPDPVLWIGSAGLAAALARRLAPEKAQFRPRPQTRGRVLFYIGSDHPVTVRQQERLNGHPGAHLLPIRSGQPFPGVPDFHPAAVFACGGDTASAVCSALGVQTIELRREFAPGIPEGILHGGPFDSLPLFTKSGGFGLPDDLIRLADHFYA